MRTEQEKAEWKARMRQYVKNVAALDAERRAEIAAKMPILTCEGHALSIFNMCFLAMQTAIPLTIVGGFKQWQKADRCVSNGQHAAGYIYVPMIPKRDQTEIDPGELDVRFRLVPVFDVSQTEIKKENRQ